MATQICRMLELMMSSTCRQTRRTRVLLHQTRREQRRLYSLDSLSADPSRSSFGPNSPQPRAERMPPSSALTHRNLSAMALLCRPLCRYDFLDPGDIEDNIRRTQSCKHIRHFIVDPHLASIVTQCIEPDLQNTKAVIFECNPGPGVLTKSLLNAGAPRVVALEGDETFLADLHQLEGRLDGQLEVVHCDYFKLSPIDGGHAKPPVMNTDKLFTDLGISESSWADDVPVKVVGILSQHNQRSLLLKMVYSLFERLSVYQYGRVELNLFISEREYRTLVSSPGDMAHYKALSVLWQMACDIELLHKAPWEAFVKSSRRGVPSKKNPQNDHMCLVRLRPRRSLFSGGLTPYNSSALVVVVKQCLAKRKGKLIDKLNLWSPDSGSKLLTEMGMPHDIQLCHVYPEEFLQLFLLMERSQEFTESWLYKDTMENSF